MPKFSGSEELFDRQAFHVYLYNHANSRGVVKINHKVLAEDIGCGTTTLANLLRELKLLGKVERVVAPGNHAYYRVEPPEDAPAKKQTQRVLQWG